MKMTEIKVIAKQMGIKPGKKKKADLIRTIQNEEGNTACFMTEKDECDQMQCSWRDDCMPD